ncbi:bifunctional adenosylcobinamide kinase/adenosylcobinamide-phosphate guanylyltransferase [Clostridium oryzae]|uniref:Adenosylcobinamide kinase n=1 Tax=Clostridium oryzae TaxID=1450648 RepID=A0A1V4ISR6_9CLOT|nr:bifunctional adenosylcobinamide kinase/adenosylcobinamide-phosphate guanylyltransferase [Clostridium oryzae]OPJ63068.1 bifunctional adenosylcobalamin biosynthesis protein CobU [Clostridium oryzae]
MSKVILITGGSRSGKSSYGEKMLSGQENVLYIATSAFIDEEMEERIKKHKERRNPNWSTYEGYKELRSVISDTDKDYIMLECVTTMITNMMFDRHTDFDSIKREDAEKLEIAIISEFEGIVEAARSNQKYIIFITNEVGWSLVSEYKLGRIFSDIAGRVNQRLAQLSDEVYLTACGIPLKLK